MATIPNPTKSRTWDLGTSANGTFFDTEFNQLYANDNDLDTRVQSLEGVVRKYALLNRAVASGTVGGAATTGAWTKYATIAEVIDVDGIVSVSSSVMVLAAGTYDARIFPVSGPTDGIRWRLRNTTDGATLLKSVTGHGSGSVSSTYVYPISGRFTIAAGKNVELQYYATSNSGGTSSLGYASSTGEDEIYATLEFEKVS